MLQEFKNFIARGNVIDLAVGVVIGGAFGKLVDGVVNGLIMPIVAMVKTASFDKNALWNGAASLTDGILNFLLLAAVVFFVFVKPMNKLKAMSEKPAAPAGPPEPTAEEKLLAEIRDLLKQKA